MKVLDKIVTRYNGWPCKVCCEYGEGDNWRTKAVRLWKHRKRTFETHLHPQRHQNALTKRSEVKRILAKGNIYREAVRGDDE